MKDLVKREYHPVTVPVEAVSAWEPPPEHYAKVVNRAYDVFFA